MSDHAIEPGSSSCEEMRPAPRPTVCVPSLSVLHLLRSQSEQACLFAPSTRTSTCRTSLCRGAKVALTIGAHALPSVRRSVSTSLHRQASVRSSLPNLDFLRPYLEGGRSRFSALASRNPLAPFGFLGENTNTSRYASTDARPLWKRPWKDKLRKERKGLKEKDSPALPSFLDDAGSMSLGRRKTVKGVNELKLRCTEFDGNGNVTFMDGEFKKSELIAKVIPICPWSERIDRRL